MSQSLNSEHRYINQKDFMMFYRYMENDDKKEMKKAGNIFQLEADYVFFLLFIFKFYYP